MISLTVRLSDNNCHITFKFNTKLRKSTERGDASWYQHESIVSLYLPAIVVFYPLNTAVDVICPHTQHVTMVMISSKFSVFIYLYQIFITSNRISPYSNKLIM